MRIGDLINIFEDDLPPLPKRAEIEAKKARHKKVMSLRREWQKREENKNKNKHSRGSTIANIYHEIEREKKDTNGDPIYIEVECRISGNFVRGYAQSHYEPGEPSTFEDVYLEWAEPIEEDPEGGPLTMKEKIAIDDWFDTPKAQEYAIEALFNAYSPPYDYSDRD
jgi:hypothetical protein